VNQWSIIVVDGAKSRMKRSSLFLLEAHFSQYRS